MMKIISNTNESERKNDWFDRILIAYVFPASLFYILAFGRRFFNFDEFQVLYASAALLRGKALYADSIGTHFPLVNILYSILINLTGFKATTLLIARYFILAANGIALFYLYRTGELLWHKKAGIMAVALTLATVTFTIKGIEIRHDVFNTLFNVMGAYYALRYLKVEKNLHLVLSGLCCGLAVASTQKALVWSVAIIVGVIIYFLRNNSYKNLLKVFLTYSIITLLPLMICVAYLILASHESIASVYKHSFMDQIYSHNPSTPEMYPFPHNRFELLKNLFCWNPLFYILGFGGIVYLALSGLRGDTKKIVLVSWTVIGLLFYLTVKRPFYQSLLPTIPPLALVASGFLIWTGERLKELKIYKKVSIWLLCTLLLLLWPGYFMFDSIYGQATMGRQIDNVAFCLGSLKQDEKVMSLSQNQVFFDPVLEMYGTDCGKNLVFWDADCFERKMIKAQSKIVIYDYRTSILNEPIQKRIKENYIYTGVGDILIPGFKIPPKTSIEKNIWIDGSYHIPASSLLIDGKKIDGDTIKLSQRTYAIQNRSDKTVLFVYKFKT